MGAAAAFMDDAKREVVSSWLIKARNDLDTARQISTLPDGHLDVAIYHCQQAAEKALKGFLAYHDHSLERSHDIERLITQVSKHESKLTDWSEAAATLTPYATAYRYPGESVVLEPTRSEFDEALNIATALMRFVFSLLPPDVQPA